MSLHTFNDQSSAIVLSVARNSEGKPIAMVEVDVCISVEIDEVDTYGCGQSRQHGASKIITLELEKFGY
jgi:hypothetical protein